MNYSSEYPNLYFGRRQTPITFIHEKLPSGYHVFQSEDRKAHIVPKRRVRKGGPWKKGVALCMADTDFKQEDKVYAKEMCIRCLQTMDKKMERYLWDDENEEYYDPMKE